MLSPDEEKVLQIGFDAALRPVNHALSNIAGPSSKTIGRMLNAMLCTQMRNVVRVYSLAAEMLNKAGIPLAPVPLKLLRPILDGASMEEEEYLQEQWAALLANATQSPQDRRISAAFPDILRQLSSTEAKYIQTVYDDYIIKSQLAHTPPLQWPTSADGFVIGAYKDLQEKLHSCNLTNVEFDNLVRLRLIRVEERLKTVSNGLQITTEREYFLTNLAEGFLLACQPPKARSARPQFSP